MYKIKTKILTILLASISFCFTPSAEAAKVGSAKVENQSVKDIQFFFSVTGCGGVCKNKYGSGRATCCGGDVVKANATKTISNGDGGGGGLPFSQNAMAQASYSGTETNNKEKKWKYKHNNGWISWTTNNSKLKFPDDFNVSNNDKKWLMPKEYKKTTKTEYISKGSFDKITNQTGSTITTPIADIGANGSSIDVQTIKGKKGSPFTGNTITFTSTSATYTFTFDKTENSLTLESTLAGVKETVYKSQLFINALFSKYETNGSQINQYWISLTINNSFEPEITQITINLNTPKGDKTVTLTQQQLISDGILNVVQKTASSES